MDRIKNSIAKIVLVVEDMESKLDHFRSLFAVGDIRSIVSENTAPPAGTDYQTIFRGHAIKGKVKMANVDMGDIMLELIEPLDHESPWYEFYNTHGEGIFSIVFNDEEFDRHAESLARQGMGLYHFGSYPGGRYAYFDTEKNLGTTLCLQQLNINKENA